MQTFSITPIVRIFDEVKAREFYIDWLGFSVDFEHRIEPDTPLYMGISMGDVKIHLSEHHGDGSPNHILTVHCKGLREFHSNLKPYKYYRPTVENYQWMEGYISMMVYDPFNNRLIFLEKEA